MLRCRQNVLKILLEHPDNKIPMSRFTTNKRSLEGEGEGEDGAKKTKVVHERSVCFLLPIAINTFAESLLLLKN